MKAGLEDEDVRVMGGEEFSPESDPEFTRIMGHLNNEAKKISESEGKDARSALIATGEFYAIRYRTYFSDLIKPNLDSIRDCYEKICN